MRFPLAPTGRARHAASAGRQAGLPLRLPLVLLLLLLAEATAKAKTRRGVRIVTLEKGDCRRQAEQGDSLSVHYVGKLKDGTIFDEGTEKVGRPMEVKLGESSVIQGWHIGLEGICMGEKRRLVVPSRLGYADEGSPQAGIPGGATLVFDVELVLLNGQSTFLASASEAAEELCDSCHRVVEGFYEEWTRVMMDQQSSIQQRQGGSEPPAVTYNDETEAMVQGFCDSKAISSGAFKDSVTTGCREIFKGYKREIVGKFLTETVTWEMVPRKKDEICKIMVGACSHRPPISTPGSDCARCKAAMASLEFDIRTQGDVRAAKGVARQMWDTLDYICMRMHYRVPKAGKTQELCDDVVDEYGAQIVKRVEAGADWATVTDLVCGEWGDYCTTAQLRDEL
eukprot:jgi/Tetstr1/442173/TSEL_030324.t1